MAVRYSSCRIQFIPNDQQHPKKDYSDRSLLELRQHDYDNYSIRALDIENNKEVIFDIPFKKGNQYQRGHSANQPDEIRSEIGTYRLWLNATSRTDFHKALDACTELLGTLTQSNRSSDESDQETDIRYNNEVQKEPKRVIPERPDTTDSTTASPKDLLLDVHRLGKYIEKGDVHEAGRLASKLASKNIRLTTNVSKATQNEKEFMIHVQIDGNEYGIDQQGARFPIDVFQSTTIRELRAVFEIVYQYSPSSQYFFVNGSLAPDHATMKDLNVGPNSVFVLFLLTHPKTFRKTGPWTCPPCGTNNHQDRLRCSTCSAVRID